MMFLIVMLACKPGKQIYVSHDSTFIKIDSIHLKIFADSTSRDTVRYSKQYVSYRRSLKTLHPWWATVGALILIVTILLIRK